MVLCFCGCGLSKVPDSRIVPTAPMALMASIDLMAPLQVVALMALMALVNSLALIVSMVPVMLMAPMAPMICLSRPKSSYGANGFSVSSGSCGPGSSSCLWHL